MRAPVIIIRLSMAVVAAYAVAYAAPAAEPARAAPACQRVSLGPQAGTAEKCMAPGAGKTDWFKDCPTCPEMVVVPGGALTFQTASQGIDTLAADAQTATAIIQPLAVGRFAVTFAEWDACAGAGGCGGYKPPDQGWGRDKRPVINVSWSDAEAYVAWLSAKTGKKYRLLSGSEREYVARAGTRTQFWFGEAITLDQANFDIPVTSRGGMPEEGGGKVRHQTLPVDSFAANPWGLYNVHGNVWEWTSSCMGGDSGPVLADETAPLDAPQALPAEPEAQCGSREARGGSWLDFAPESASGARIGFTASSRNMAQGFRVARELP